MVGSLRIKRFVKFQLGIDYLSDGGIKGFPCVLRMGFGK
jgi:hypothetical protein